MGDLNPASPVEDAAAQFLEFLERERNYAPHTLAAYRGDLLQFVRYLYPRSADPRVPLSMVQPQTVAGFAAELTARGLKPASIARKLAAIRSLFRYLCRQRAVAANPAAGVFQELHPRQASPGLRLDRVRIAMETSGGAEFQDARDLAILEVFYGGGLALGELVGLSLSTVNLESGTVRVMGRGRRERIVPIGRQALAALRTYLQRRAALLVGLEITQVEAGALFVNKRGRRLTPRSVQRVVERCLLRAAAATGDEAALQPGLRSPQALRHAYATHMIDAGADVAAVKALLGHAPATTSRQDETTTLDCIRAIYDRAHPLARTPAPTDSSPGSPSRSRGEQAENGS
jgi:integrase/recombinase XerC